MNSDPTDSYHSLKKEAEEEERRPNSSKRTRVRVTERSVFVTKSFGLDLWFKKLSLVVAFLCSHFLEKRNKKKQKQKLHLEPILWSDRLASRFLSQETNKNNSLEIFIIVKNSSPR